MGFYREQKIAFNELDNRIKRQVINEKQSLSITELLLELTKRYELSEKNLLRRIEYYPKLYPQLKIVDNRLINMEADD